MAAYQLQLIIRLKVSSQNNSTVLAVNYSNFSNKLTSEIFIEVLIVSNQFLQSFIYDWSITVFEYLLFTFIDGSFKNVSNGEDYTGSNSGISKQGIRQDVKWRGQNLIWYTIPEFTWRAWRNARRPSAKKSRSPNRDSKPGPPEFERVPSRRLASEKSNRCTIICMLRCS
jgi:hypothetical protein